MLPTLHIESVSQTWLKNTYAWNVADRFNNWGIFGYRERTFEEKPLQSEYMNTCVM